VQAADDRADRTQRQGHGRPATGAEQGPAPTTTLTSPSTARRLGTVRPVPST
jgi:hypothetical protein